MPELINGMKLDRLNRYQSKGGSQHHVNKYQGRRKVWSHRVECAMLQRLLERAGHSEDILDAPCGAGRFFPVIAQHARNVFLGDISSQMLAMAHKHTEGRATRYQHVDLRSVSTDTPRFEGVISLRLTHHIYDADVLNDYLQSLSLLARRWVIISFRDTRAPWTQWRRLTHSIKDKEPLPSQTIAEISELMADNGFHLLADEDLSKWLSGHRYALYHRCSAHQETSTS
ncbi:MAG: class I SAM-dependent methyltransferase [Candidatus Hydrogenedentota bacterium]